ncbi:MAG: serpin family protein [bacterium]
MKKLISILFAVFMLFAVSCSNSTNGGDGEDVNDDTEVNDGNGEDENEMQLRYQEADEHADSVSSEITEANTAFATKIFNALSQEEEGENMMISPLSISIALAMTINGASGENLDEMKEVMEFADMDMSDVNEQFYHLIQSLVEADKDMILAIANSVWMDDDFEPRVKEKFLDVLDESYDAEAYALDFNDPDSVDVINDWVKENTMEKIEKIIEEIGADTVMYLINAIYFKAAWTITFDKESTYDGEFTCSDGTKKTVEMMTFKDNQDFDFYSSGSEEGDYSVIRLPYGREKFAFYGIVPNGGSIDALISEMAENGIDSYLSNLVETEEVPVIMPKFKFEYEKSLVDIFKTLEMEKAFKTGGFLELAENGDNLYISDIIHKTYIEVNEEGTEAAAVTAVAVGETAMPSGFYGNRPFVYLIRDDRSDTILFMGKVEDPTEEE